MFPNFNDNNFNKSFEQHEKLFKKTFGLAIAAGIISAILGIALTIAVIYFLVKAAGAL